jgi:hypothetical protein
VPARRKTPLSTVPFDRDPDFVGRQDVLIALESRFSQRESHKRVVLVGLGGVGYAFSPYSLFYLLFYLTSSPGNHRSLSNTLIGSEFVTPRPGSSGCMPILPRDLNKVIDLLPLY